MEEPAEEAATTILPEEPEAMAEAEEDAEETASTATEAMAAPGEPMAAEVGADAHTAPLTALPALAEQKAPTAAQVEPEETTIPAQKERPGPPGPIPSAWDLILKAPEPEAQHPPNMAAVVAEVATVVLVEQPDPEAWPEAAEAAATVELAERAADIPAPAVVAVAMAEMVEPEEAVPMGPEAAVDTAKPETAVQEQRQRTSPTTEALPQEAEALEMHHQQSITATAALESVSLPIMHKGAEK